MELKKQKEIEHQIQQDKLRKERADQEREKNELKRIEKEKEI